MIPLIDITISSFIMWQIAISIRILLYHDDIEDWKDLGSQYFAYNIVWLIIITFLLSLITFYG